MHRRLVAAATAIPLVALAVAAAPGLPAQAEQTEVAPTLKSQIQYVIIPHPDDESQSWPMIANSSANYPVFIVLTHGDHTSLCGIAGEHLAGFEPEAGELPPVPEPVVGDFATCDAARLNSWHLFLDQMAVRDPHLDVPAFVGTLPITVACSDCSRAQRIPTTSSQSCEVSTIRTPVVSYELYVGVSSARMVFDFGDCDLKPSEVAAAVHQARANRASGLFPVTKEYGIIGASFFNTAANGCAVYGHADHGAVHTALRGNNFGTPGPQWGRTTMCDTSPGRTDTLPTAYYQDLFAATATTRPGIMQRTYGWLHGGYWPFSVDDRGGSFWNQTVRHWAVY